MPILILGVLQQNLSILVLYIEAAAPCDSYFWFLNIHEFSATNCSSYLIQVFCWMATAVVTSQS